MQIEYLVWILLAYTIGTVVGLSFNSFTKRKFFEAGVSATVEELIEQGYLKAETAPNGETVLIKADDEV